MKYINHNDTEFLIAHFQGGSYAQYKYPTIEDMLRREVSIPENVSIVTVVSNNILSSSPILYQCYKNKIDVINNARDYYYEWNNVLKPQFIIDGLEKVKTEYCLVLDGGDVLLTGHIHILDILNRFSEYKKKILFGATKSNYPDVIIDKVERRDWYGNFRYLNAGTVFGKTKDLLEFYMRVEKLSKEIDNPFNSEQFLIRHVFEDNQGDVGFDYNCNIFQTFGKTTAFHPDLNNINTVKII